MIGVFFKRGLRALLPTVLTIGVIVIVYNFFADSIVGPVNRGIRAFLSGTWPGRQVLDFVLEADIDGLSREQTAKVLDQAYRSAPWLEPMIGFFVAFRTSSPRLKLERTATTWRRSRSTQSPPKRSTETRAYPLPSRPGTNAKPSPPSLD